MTTEQAKEACLNSRNVYYLSTNNSVIIGTIVEVINDGSGVCVKLRNIAHTCPDRYINVNFVFGNRDDAETYKMTGQVTGTIQPPEPTPEPDPVTIRDIIKDAVETYQIRGKLTSDMDRLLNLICHSFGVNDVPADGGK